ncbi:MAG: hypothetical protein U5J96_07785 [Ignavibacteriaceae bacterium]|nr:hypothetical protein [Ignavibacteriaceae bacterium]
MYSLIKTPPSILDFKESVKNAATGMYIYGVITEKFTAIKKMIKNG